MDNLLVICSILIPLYVVFGPKGNLTVELYKQVLGKRSGPLSLLNCYTPVFNSYMIQKLLYNKSPYYLSMSMLALSMSIAVIVGRVILPDNVVLNLIITYFTLIALVILYISEVLIMWELCDVLDQSKYKILAILFPPLCAFLLTPKVRIFFKKHNHTLDGTFDAV